MSSKPARGLQRVGPTQGVAYVRMSTDPQNFSIQQQCDKIYTYAAAHGIEIIRVYADKGKSGLNLKDRAELRKLLVDVQAAAPDFSVVLVYDISRWGRFQDVDESAYYDHLCRRAGIEVIYCAEQFDNDGSVVSSILKGLKRAMAAEYSRELSSKVFEAQCSFTKQGFKQGGSAGYGFRRISIAEGRETGPTLRTGERKINLTDRVKLVPGPEHEIENLRRIYQWYVGDKLGEKDIAARLNTEGVPTETGRPWTRWLIQGILTNEKYIGNLLYNRKSGKLKNPFVNNPAERWVRVIGAFTALIPLPLFQSAAEERVSRVSFVSNAELLVMLKALHDREGNVTPMVLRDHVGIPGHKAYIGRFGSLSRAYELAGIPLSPTALKRVASKYRIALLRKNLYAEVADRMKRAGALVSNTGDEAIVIINRSIVAKIVVGRAANGYKGLIRWKIPMTGSPAPDFVIAVLLDKENVHHTDFFLLPTAQFDEPTFICKEERPEDLDQFRHPDLASIFGQAY